jgi:3-oxoacyl-[acyl-carrier-protein] synthase II
MRGDRGLWSLVLGCVSPVGNDVATAWQSIQAGRSGIGPLTAFDSETFYRQDCR